MAATRRAGGQNAPSSSLKGGRSDSAAKSALEYCPPVQTLILECFPSPATARALSPNGRAHWGVESRAKKLVETVVMAEVRRQGIRPFCVPVRLTARWIFPTRSRRDLDNLSTGVVKKMIDTLVDLGILPADDSRHVVEMSAEAVYEKGRRALIVILEGIV